MKAEAKEAAQKDAKQYAIADIVLNKRITKVPVTRRIITRQDVLEDAFTYQIPKEVAQIMKQHNGESYPVCPRCKMTIEREYMSFCDRCGQKLGWTNLEDAVFVYPGYYFVENKRKSVTFLYFKYIYPVKKVRRQGCGKDGARETHSRGAE